MRRRRKSFGSLRWSEAVGEAELQKWATSCARALKERLLWVRLGRLSLNSGIETADSADFTDFEGVIGGRTYESLRGKTSGR